MNIVFVLSVAYVCLIFLHVLEEMKEEIRGLKEGVYGIQVDTADIKELKEFVYDIRGDTQDLKKQIKMLQEVLAKTNIANPEAPSPGELHLVCFCLPRIL